MAKNFIVLGTKRFKLSDLKQKYEKYCTNARHTILNDLVGGFDVMEKEDGSPCTSTDLAVEADFVREFRKDFPGIGICCEEGVFNAPCTMKGLEGHDLYGTGDPIDGTRAYTERYFVGFGFMTSLVFDLKTLITYICEPRSGAMFYFLPDGKGVREVSLEGAERKLTYRYETMKGQHVLLREDLRSYTSTVQEKILKHKNHKKSYFGGVGVQGGGICIMAIYLCTGQYAMAILRPNTETPWDSPVYALLQEMGFQFYLLNPREVRLDRWHFVPTREIFSREEELIVVHESVAHELFDLLDLEVKQSVA